MVAARLEVVGSRPLVGWSEVAGGSSVFATADAFLADVGRVVVLFLLPALEPDEGGEDMIKV